MAAACFNFSGVSGHGGQLDKAAKFGRLAWLGLSWTATIN